MPFVASNSRFPVRPGSTFRAIGVWLGSLIVIAATIGLLALLAWTKYTEIQAAMNTPPPAETPTTVGVQDVGSLTWRNSTNSIGTILAPRSITVNNEMSGTVTEILFEAGQIVEEGTKLLQLDDAVERAQLKAAQVREDFSRTTFERNQKLATGDAITPSELEEFQSSWRQAQAQVEELQAMIDRKAIKAPFRGRLGLTDVHKGQYLVGGSKITTLQSVDEYILVEFTLAQNVVNQIQSGEPIKVQSSGVELPAKVSAIDAQADRLTRNVRVRARMDNPPTALSPGDSVSVRIEYGPQMELPAVPAESVRRSPQGTFVYMAEKNTAGEWRASARPVVLATSVGSAVGIAHGVATGESIIVEGSFKLQDGALIAPAEPAEPAAENREEPSRS